MTPQRLLIALSSGIAILVIAFFAGLALFAQRHQLDLVGALRVRLAETTATQGERSALERLHPAVIRWTGMLEAPELRETSGMARSQRRDDYYWAVNDSGNPAELHALRSNGRAVGIWPLENTAARDWEAMASFRYQGEPFLLIADTGDNLRWHKTHTLLLLKEPDPQQPPTKVQPTRRLTFRLPDGPRDIEAVAVDGRTGQAILVTKRRIPPEAYAVSLMAPQAGSTAVALGQLAELPQPPAPGAGPRGKSRYRFMPSDLALSEAFAVVATYEALYFYPRTGSWANTFAARPRRMAIPPLGQLEAIAFNETEDKLLLLSERRGGTGPVGVYQVVF